MKTKQASDHSLILKMFTFQNELKIYHWNTFSYSRHKTTDHLFQELIEFIDTFIETYMGRFGRLQLQDKKNPIKIKMNIISDSQAFDFLQKFASFLNDMESYLPEKKKISSLLNLRDDMLGHIYQALYLFSLQ